VDRVNLCLREAGTQGPANLCRGGGSEANRTATCLVAELCGCVLLQPFPPPHGLQMAQGHVIQRFDINYRTSIDTFISKFVKVMVASLLNRYSGFFVTCRLYIYICEAQRVAQNSV
jgi:hypothetical protein